MRATVIVPDPYGNLAREFGWPGPYVKDAELRVECEGTPLQVRRFRKDWARRAGIGVRRTRLVKGP